VVYEYAATDFRAGVYLNARAAAGALRKCAGKEKQAFSVQKMRYAMPKYCPNTGVE
jgi:hypothetical protein